MMAQADVLPFDVGELREMIMRLRSRESEFKASISNQQLRFKEELQRLMGKLTTQKESITALERQNERLMTDKEDLMSALAQARAEAHEANQERNRQQEHADKLTEELAQTMKVWTGAMKQRDETIRQQAAALSARPSEAEFLLSTDDMDRSGERRSEDNAWNIDIPDSSAKQFAAQLRMQVRSLRAELLTCQVENRRLAAISQALRKVTSSEARPMEIAMFESATANVAQRIADLHRAPSRPANDTAAAAREESPKGDGKGMRLSSLAAAKEGLYDTASPPSPRNTRDMAWKVAHYQSQVETLTAERDEFRRMLQESVAIRTRTESDLGEATALLASARTSIADTLTTTPSKGKSGSLLRTKTVGSLRGSPQHLAPEGASPRSPQAVDWEKEKQELRAKLGQVQLQLDVAVHAARMHEERAATNAERAETLFRQLTEAKSAKDNALKELEDHKLHTYEVMSAFKQKEGMASDLRNQLETQQLSGNRIKEAVSNCRKSAIALIGQRTTRRELQLAMQRWAFVVYRMKHLEGRRALKAAALSWIEKIPQVVHVATQRAVFAAWREHVARRKTARRVLVKAMRWRAGNAWTQWLRAVHLQQLSSDYQATVVDLRKRLQNEVASVQHSADQEAELLQQQLEVMKQQLETLAADLSITRAQLVTSQQAQRLSLARIEELTALGTTDAAKVQQMQAAASQLQNELRQSQLHCDELQEALSNEQVSYQAIAEESSATAAQLRQQLADAHLTIAQIEPERDKLLAERRDADLLNAVAERDVGFRMDSERDHRRPRLPSGSSTPRFGELPSPGGQLADLIAAAKLREEVIVSLRQQLAHALATRGSESPGKMSRKGSFKVVKAELAELDSSLDGHVDADRGANATVDHELYLADIATASLRADVAESEITSVKSELAKTLAEKTHEICRLHDALVAEQLRHEATLSELVEVNRLMPALQQQVMHFRGEIANTQSADSRLVLTLEDWKAQRSHLETVLQETSANLEKALSENQTLASQNAELSDALANMGDATDRIEELVQAEIVAKQSISAEEVVSLQRQLATALATSEHRQQQSLLLENECISLKDKLTSLQAQVDEAQHTVLTQTSPRAECDRQAAILASQNATIAEQERRLAEYSGTSAQLEQQIATLRIENDAQQHELKTLRAATVALQQNLRDSKAQLEQSTALIEEQRGLLVDHADRTDVVTNLHSGARADIARAEQERDAAQAKAADAAEQLQNLRKEIEVFRLKQAEIGALAAADRSRADELLAKLRSQGEQVAAASAALKQLQNENLNLVTALNEANAKLASNGSARQDAARSPRVSPAKEANVVPVDDSPEVSLLRNQLAAEKTARTQLNAQIISMRSEHVILTGKHAAAVTRADELQAEISRVYERTTADSSASSSQLATIKQLQSDLDSARARNAKLADQVTDLESRLAQATSVSASAAETKQDLLQLRVTCERQAKELVSLEASYKTKMAVLEAAAANVSPQVKDAKQLAQDWEQRCIKLQQELQTLRTQLGDLQEQHEQQSVVLTSRQHRVQELEQALAQCEQQFREHKAAAAETERTLKQEVSSYRDTVLARNAAGTPSGSLHRVVSLQAADTPAPQSATLVFHAARTVEPPTATGTISSAASPSAPPFHVTVNKAPTQNAFGIESFTPPSLSS
jgi:chromosome segregation ATPase